MQGMTSLVFWLRKAPVVPQVLSVATPGCHGRSLGSRTGHGGCGMPTARPRDTAGPGHAEAGRGQLRHLLPVREPHQRSTPAPCAPNKDIKVLSWLNYYAPGAAGVFPRTVLLRH